MTATFTLTPLPTAPQPPEQTDLTVLRGDISVPTTLWMPTHTAPTGIVLLGHGGYGNRTDTRTLELAHLFTRRHSLAALAIDGPVHGDRRADRSRDPEVIKPDWQKLWHAEPGIDGMVADWQAALAVARTRLPRIPVGYFGLSMGCLYGLPLVAADPTIRAAVLGMWGTNNNTGARLHADAEKITIPVLHYVRWNDQIFDRPSLIALFNALGTHDKLLVADPGPHGNPAARQTDILTTYLADRLLERDR